MLYIEHQPSRRSLLLLALMAPLLYLSAVQMLELTSVEGIQSALARDMVATGDYVKTHLYGRPVREYPLYGWLVCLFSGFRPPTLLSLRLPAILSVWGIALLSGLNARRMQSNFAGFIAAATVLLSVIGFQEGLRARTDMLQAFLTTAAWYSWFQLGIDGKRWNTAWVLSTFLVLLGIFNVGLKACLLFYLPLLFMPRRINVRLRMQMPAHLVAVLVAALVVCVWLSVSPDQPLMPWNRESRLIQFDKDSSGYLWHLISFPWKTLFSLLPWSILLWAPFCIALRQFEKAPVACHYLRVIIFTFFFAIWLFPHTTPIQLLPLLGPVAILIGVHFEIVLRRHQAILNRLLHIAAWLTVAGNTLGALFWGAVCSGFISIMDCQLRFSALFAFVLALLGYLTWRLILSHNSHCTFRSCIVWCICAARFMLLFTATAYRNWDLSDKRWAGEQLAGTCSAYDIIASPNTSAITEMPPTGTLAEVRPRVSCIYYRPAKANSPLYLSEFHHLNVPVILLSATGDWNQELPDDLGTVYVLSSRVPAQPSRSWRALSHSVNMNLRRHIAIMLNDNANHQHAPWLSLEQLPDPPNDLTDDHLQLFEGTPLHDDSTP